MPHFYERKTSDIFISEQFRNILEIFSDKSEVARTLLYKRLNKDILVDEHINFICISKNDPTKISYLSQDRIENIAKSETDDYWTTSKRFACKPGGFVGKILKDISPKEVENFASLYKTFASKKDVEFKIVSGDDILKYYHHENYFNQRGSLGNSCMKSNSCQEYFDIYTKNPMISMLVMLAPNEKLLGRALLWQIGDEKIMDRIYTIQDDTHLHHMTKWATDNGYIYKAYQKWQTCQTFSDGKNEFERKLSIKIDSWNHDSYPYLDSFKWLDVKTGILTNFKPENFTLYDDNSDDFRTLTSSCGDYERGDYLAFCEIDREYSHRGDITELNGIFVNTRHCNYSNTLDTWILRSESSYSEDLEDYIYTDSSRNDVKLVERRLEYLEELRGGKKKKKGKELMSLFNSIFASDSWTTIGGQIS
jgi:hypothetical protein